jgi:TonB family protein
MNSTLKGLLAGIILTASLASASNKKQEEAKALIDRAKQLSQIRGDGLTAFRMKVNFKVVKQDSTTEQGTYTETWVSPEKWRSETIVGDFHRVIVVNANKRWTSNASSTPPVGFGELGFRMDLPLFSMEFWKVDKIEDRESSSVSMRCLESQPNSMGGRSALCFDKTTGLVSAHVLPVALGDRVVERTCAYSNYEKFGDRVFPHAEECLENNKPIFESALVELATENSPDAALFTPLVDAKESVNCRGTPNPPQAISTPLPVSPRQENPSHPVVVLLSLGTDGVPKDVKVVRSYDSAFDKAAMEALRNWRFKPASCDGQPIEAQINVEVTFRSF